MSKLGRVRVRRIERVGLVNLVSVCKRVFSVGFVHGWTQCLLQVAGAPLAMLRGRRTGFPPPPKMGARAFGQAG